MDNPHKDAVNKLNDLIQIAADGRDGYENAAENIDDHSAKASFRKFSQERAAYVSQLQQEVIGLNGKPKESDGDIQGALHRTWLDIKATFTGGDRDAIIDGCITGEESAVESYEKALEKDYIQGRTRELLNQHLSGIKNALNVIKSYKNPT
jgi:uncharacterized protein (TIGR02284 family)